ncbi:unnamed protein product [Citrullus colocynthis]|uniref:Uncharacterized protein n=1 Tax=Citrullus colocynthis TaxID=252529 RepID=A0ABP0XLM1_9ROSI
MPSFTNLMEITESSNHPPTCRDVIAAGREKKKSNLRQKDHNKYCKLHCDHNHDMESHSSNVAKSAMGRPQLKGVATAKPRSVSDANSPTKRSAWKRSPQTLEGLLKNPLEGKERASPEKPAKRRSRSLV